MYVAQCKQWLLMPVLLTDPNLLEVFLSSPDSHVTQRGMFSLILSKASNTVGRMGGQGTPPTSQLRPTIGVAGDTCKAVC